MTDPETCPSCGGSGNCYDCEGDDEDCSTCCGSGECQECEGYGFLTED